MKYTGISLVYFVHFSECDFLNWLTMSSEAKTKCVTVTWNIENFSAYFSPNVKICLRSPVWKTKTTEGRTSWWRVLMGYTADSKSIEFHLANLKDEKDDNLYQMSLITSDGQSPIPSQTSNFLCYASFGLIEKSLILGKNSKSFLPKDTLTFCCKIIKQTIEPGKCLLRTVLHPVNFLWNIEGVSSDPKIQKRTLHQHETLLLYATLYKYEKDDHHKVRVEFYPNTGICSAFLGCKMSIKDDRGHVSTSSNGFPSASWSWNVENAKSSLCLKIECLVATDMEYQQLLPHSPDTLTDDFLQLYKEKMYSDATLNSKGKSFPVHRGILAARSPVFRAMFEKNKMSEGRSGIVNIDDVDSETVDRMLVFLYGGLLEDMNWEEAFPLYYAADKYGVLPLKEKCADILKAGLSVDNACDSLVLADKYSDEQLMKCTVDFLHDHVEVISSTEWKSLKKSHPHLIIDTLTELHLRGNK